MIITFQEPGKLYIWWFGDPVKSFRFFDIGSQFRVVGLGDMVSLRSWMLDDEIKERNLYGFIGKVVWIAMGSHGVFEAFDPCCWVVVPLNLWSHPISWFFHFPSLVLFFIWPLRPKTSKHCEFEFRYDASCGVRQTNECRGVTGLSQQMLCGCYDQDRPGLLKSCQSFISRQDPLRISFGMPIP